MLTINMINYVMNIKILLYKNYYKIIKQKFIKIYKDQDI